MPQNAINFLRFGARDYVTDPFFKLNKMLSFSPEEVLIGVFSSVTYVTYMVLIVFCFRKAEQGRKNKSRFDNVIHTAADEGKVKLPETTFKPPDRNEYNSKKIFEMCDNFCFLRKTPGCLYGWAGYFYYIGWLLTLLTLLGSMGMVTLYGMQFSNMKTYQWLTSMVINFFYTLFIVEPCKESIRSCKRILRK